MTDKTPVTFATLGYCKIERFLEHKTLEKMANHPELQPTPKTQADQPYAWDNESSLCGTLKK